MGNNCCGLREKDSICKTILKKHEKCDPAEIKMLEDKFVPKVHKLHEKL